MSTVLCLGAAEYWPNSTCPRLGPWACRVHPEAGVTARTLVVGAPTLKGMVQQASYSEGDMAALCTGLAESSVLGLFESGLR